MIEQRFLMKGCLFSLLMVSFFARVASGASNQISADTETCIECHATTNPGIVGDWKRSRMSQITPEAARKKDLLERRVSFKQMPQELARVVVGCAECHTLRAEEHRDTFEHNGYEVHVVVSPRDCATCHPVEADQFSENLMSHAYLNLNNNRVHQDLSKNVNGIQSLEGTKTILRDPDEKTLADSCYYCHGTEVKVEGTETRETEEGEMEFPVLSGWPNRGVGRINPDMSMGACSACHTRHQFAIQMARKPYTCSQCHKGPDVPAYKVYAVSKHGNIHAAMGGSWNYSAVPWTVGEDFTAPTCAVCHVSLVVSNDGEIVAKRTHQMNDRIAWRIFGLIYAHAHPKSPDTTIVENRAGLPLPTELTGEPVAKYLIDRDEQQKRRKTMQKGCLACHSLDWVQGQFDRFENTIRTTNEMTLTATKLVLAAWENGQARGLSRKDSIFNEAIEKKWVEQWLFFANSTRYASAMMGGDYGVFANGRWYMSKNIQEMIDWLEFKRNERR